MRRFVGAMAAGALVLAACADATDGGEDASDRTTTTTGTDSSGGVASSGGLDPSVEIDLGRSTEALPVAAPAGTVGKRFAAAANAAVRLSPFAECTDLLDHVQREAAGRVGAYGLAGDPYGSGFGFGGERFEDLAVLEGDVDIAFDAADEAAAPAEAGRFDDVGGSPEPGVDFSTTNVQEVGVDEPDLVKTDGEVLVTVLDGSLQVLDVSGDTPTVESTTYLDSGWDHELLLGDDRVFVFSRDGGYAVMPYYDEAFDGDLPEVLPIPEGSDVTIIREIDISNPANPSIDATQILDGSYVSARVVDGVARVVITSRPSQLPFVQPGGAPGSDALATSANQAVVESSDIDDWIPAVVTVDGQGQITEERLVDCGQVGRPAEFAGFGMLSVVSIDLAEPLDVSDVVSVMADGDTVYASGEALYVATNAWIDPVVVQDLEDTVEDLIGAGLDIDDIEDELEDELIEQVQRLEQTSIHKFELTDGSANYVASGAVSGRLLNQFALSEYEGVLRVAYTAGNTWDGSSESFVTTFRSQDGELVEQGSVGGLGRGESIFAVRMIEDKGYVVTFRQVDPLYVVDLSDPADPTVEGELKIPGYSSYLHLVGDDLLLGVGQDADPETGFVEGAQVSLFDVSDPTNPQRIDQLLLGQGNAGAEWDHRAFLHWAPEDLAVLPVDLYDYDLGGSQFNGAIALDLEGRTISEAGRISHAVEEICYYEEYLVDEQGNESFEVIEEPCYYDYGSSIQRAVVLGDDLLTLSSSGVGVNDLTTLDDEGFVGF